MDLSSCKHWGVLVRPGETVKCNPGDLYCHISQIALQDDKGNEAVRVFVKVGGNEILIGTLSADKFPQCTVGLVFEKEFELLHTSKTSNISALGYKFRETKSYSDTSTSEDDDSDGEVPLAIPLYPNTDANTDDDKSNETKSGVEEPSSTQFCKPKNTLEETKDPEKLKADGIDNDENSIDSEEGESGDDEDSSDEDDSSDELDGKDSLKNTMGKNRPAETPLKTPLNKKAKIATPSMGNKTGSASTKKSGYIHVATPYPSSKQVKKSHSIIDSAKQPTGYSCKSCSKTFHSSVALDTHCKVKQCS